MSFLNVAGYGFLKMPEDLETLREELFNACKALDIRGILYLCPEGFNTSLCGSPDSIAQFKTLFEKALGRTSPFDFKESWSEKNAFKKVRVRIKRETIPLGAGDFDFHQHPVDRLDPEVLKEWLDQKKDLVLLDTRNDYEVRMGTFAGAHVPHIEHFRNFPEASKQFPEEWKDKTVVTFCTGGIRCEKAAPYLKSVGFKEIYQLEGGILRYFEKVGADHYNGECFVFDHRVGLNGQLEPTEAWLCRECGHPGKKSETTCSDCGWERQTQSA